MNNRIVIIHRSEIVRQGLSVIIRDFFNIDITTSPDVSELTKYSDDVFSRIIVLIDSGIETKSYPTIFSSNDQINALKCILIRNTGADSSCKDDCDCCFTLDAPKTRIFDLLNPYLKSLNDNGIQKNSSGLTEREVEVVKLVALGKTNKEIADELCISIHTVISHRKNITEKLGIKSISGLTVYAMLNNLIDAKTINPNTLL